MLPYVPLSNDGKPLWRTLPLGSFEAVLREPPGIPQLRWAKQFSNQGGVLLYFGPLQTERVLVTDPAVLKQILVNQADDFDKPGFSIDTLRKATGDGLLVTTGKTHARHRGIVSKHFAFENLRSIIPVFVQRADALAAKWRALPEGTEIEVHGVLTALTLDIIGLSAFGYQFNAVDDAGSEDQARLRKAYDQLLPGLSIRRVITNVLKIQFLDRTTVAKDAEASSIVRAKVADIVKARQAEVAAGSGSGQEAQGACKNLLDVMLRASGSPTSSDYLTAEEITDQVLTFMVAGHETTSNALAWALFALDQHPEVERKLRAEVRSTLASSPTGNLTWEALADLEYLNAVCLEVLRLYPPVPLTIRESNKDTTVTTSTGLKVPLKKGTFVMLPPFVMHRLPQYWGEDAEVFRPERHLETPIGSRGNGYAFLPFIAGPRSCIGSRFALLEMKTVLAVLVNSFSFSLKPGASVRPKLRITMRPFPSLPMILHHLPA